MRFKRNKVWVAVDEAGRPRIEKGKVLIKYQLDQAHQYQVHVKSVRPLDEELPDGNGAPRSDTKPGPPDRRAAPPSKVIHIYTDGACPENPGPAGIGAVLQYGRHQKEIARAIGTATHNIAELEAVRVALEAVKNRSLPVVVHTDSRYVRGVLGKGGPAEQDRETVAELRKLTRRFADLQFVKVKSHVGNQRAGQLAVQAVRQNR